MRTVVIFTMAVLILCLVSCSVPAYDDYLIPDFATVDEAIVWIQDNMHGEMDSTIYPIPVILDRMRGGCTSFAALFVYILKTQFDEFAVIALTKQGGYGHAVVYWRGAYYDLTDKDDPAYYPEVIYGYWTLSDYNFRASFYKL